MTLTGVAQRIVGITAAKLDWPLACTCPRDRVRKCSRCKLENVRWWSHRVTDGPPGRHLAAVCRYARLAGVDDLAVSLIADGMPWPEALKTADKLGCPSPLSRESGTPDT